MITSLLKTHPITHAFNTLQGTIAHLTFEQEALFLANTSHQKTLIIVKSNLYQAQKLYNQLYVLLKDEVVLFQADESLRFESIATSPETIGSMVENLHIFQTKKVKIVVTHLHAYLRYLPNPTMFQKQCLAIQVDQTLTKKDLETLLINNGYQKTIQVDRPMTFASRGGIIDIFSMNYDLPIRIEFFDCEVESIRFFDIATQKTISKCNTITIIPATTLLVTEEELTSLAQTIANLNEGETKQFLMEELAFLTHHHTDLRLYRLFSLLPKKYHLHDYLDAYTIYSSKEEVDYANTQFLNDTAIFHMELNQLNQTLPTMQFYHDYHFMQPDFFIHQFHPNSLQVEIHSMITSHFDKETIFLEMLQRSFNQKVIVAVNHHQIEMLQARITRDHLAHQLTLIECPITQGFQYEDTLVYSAKELFNENVTPKKKNNKFKNAKILHSYQELNVNDYVVHEKYGIGKYLGIVTKIQHHLHKDYLSVEYANQTKLFIPVEQFQLVRKYLSKDALSVQLSTIGSKKWTKEKEKIQKGIEQLAQDLLQLYTLRHSKKGYAYPQDDILQKMFEEDFEYELTRDQKQSVIEIKQEMESDKIMDRLLCGDVGFGKTEVAAISAFKAVNSGKQVAYLCPTTILSHQHFQTFKKRFKNFPIRIELFNRFVTPKQAKQIIEDVKLGNVDILIGTHRILSKDIAFKNLGFLIIDEEQRFGVSQKEKIKQYKNTVDVLSLSATPIPRTLQMSLIGIRSLSQLDTPPKNRYSVQTYILESDQTTIKSIIEREIARHGQVFYLYNDTTQIYEIANEIQHTIPDIKVGVGHGKMNKNELEDVMIKFINQEFNVLVCTTIIETGIDIPNANTIIIHDADKFGLAQLYQIKGRVGRGDKIAYAYLMYAKGKVLTEEASARLKAIKEFTQLGSGYKIAMKDLSIRGAGNMLGDKQAGFIDTIGMDMYIDLLTKEVAIQKGEWKETSQIPTSSIQIDGYIPQNFTDYDNEKLQLYQNLSKTQTIEQYYQLYETTKDQFGILPKAVQMLFEKRKIDILLSHPFIESYKENDYMVTVTYTPTYSSQVNGEHFFALTNDYAKDIQIQYENKKIILSIKKFIDYVIPFATMLENTLKLIE